MTPPNITQLPSPPPSVALVVRRLQPLQRIKAFISEYPSQQQPLVLRVDWDNYCSRSIQDALEESSVRHEYNAATNRLTLKCMSTSIHSAINKFACNSFLDMALGGFLSRSEIHLLQLSADSHILPCYQNTPPPSRNPRNRKLPADIKNADVEFCPDGASFPSVVFEVGWTESYEDLVEDARQWLVKSDGWTKVVVLVKFFEDVGPELRKRQSDGIDKDADATPPKFSAEDYRLLKSTIPEAEYVGSVTAFIELWRLDPSTKEIFLDGPRVSLLPPAQASFNPKITVADLIPYNPLEYDYEPPTSLPTAATDRAHTITSTNEKRIWTLDLDAYRSLLNKAIKQLAVTRFHRQRKLKRKRRENETPAPEVGSTTEEEEEEDEDEEEEEEQVGEDVKGKGKGKGIRDLKGEDDIEAVVEADSVRILRSAKRRK